jgi:acyl-[acyl-carrier-protein] desaturase
VEMLRDHHAFDRWGFYQKIWMPLLRLLGVTHREVAEHQQRSLERLREEVSSGEMTATMS